MCKTGHLIELLGTEDTRGNLARTVDGAYDFTTLLLLYTTLWTQLDMTNMLPRNTRINSVLATVIGNDGYAQDDLRSNLADSLMPPAGSILVEPTITTAEQVIEAVWVTRPPLLLMPGVEEVSNTLPNALDL